MSLVTESVTSFRRFEADDRRDIPCRDLRDFFSVIRMHLDDTTDSLGFAIVGVKYSSTRLEDTRIHSDEGQTTDKWIGHDLECEGRKRLRVELFEFYYLLIVIRISTNNLSFVDIKW